MDRPRSNQDPSVADPVALPDVATSPHPTPPSASAPEAGGTMQEVLPEVSAAARKVGGFKRLAEIAAKLDRAGSSQ